MVPFLTLYVDPQLPEMRRRIFAAKVVLEILANRWLKSLDIPPRFENLAISVLLELLLGNSKTRHGQCHHDITCLGLVRESGGLLAVKTFSKSKRKV